MFPIRIRACSESDLRMLGNLARNIQRVLPVTQADIDAAAALGKGWVVWKVIEVNDPLDNLRGGTQLVIKQNSVTPGQNVRRVLIVSGPSGEKVIVGPGIAPLSLPDAVANSLDYVRAYGGTEQRNIPAEYTQVEYLESSGGQYIDTGVILKGETLEVDCDFAFATVPDVGSVPRVIWGFMGPSSLPRAALFGYQGKFSYGSNSTSSLAIFIDTSKHKTVFTASGDGSQCTFSFDGTNYTGTGSPTSYTANDLSIYLFARNNDTTGVGNWSISRIYSGMKFKLDNVVVRDYITCRRLSDNELGMYDLISGQFFTNQGNGTFIAGPVVTPTPDAPMDIVSNNGVLKVSSQGQIYTDGTVETISVHSKNLFDEAQLLNATDWTKDSNGYYTGTFVSYNTAFSSGFSFDEPFKENTVYTFRCNGYVTTNRIYFIFDYTDGTSTMNPINATTATDYTFTSTPNKTLSGIRGSFGSGGTNVAWLKDVQLEVGSTATDYTPYYDGGTATCENLLSIGDHTDVQEILSGDITRKVGVRVLNGTENDYAKRSDYAINYTGLTGRVYGPDIYGVCSHFVCSASNASTAPVGSLFFNTSNIYLHFFTEYGGNVDAFKAWLASQYNAGTPVIIVYPLATETTESVAGQTLNITSGDNVIDITQASLTGLELEAEYTKEG